MSMRLVLDARTAVQRFPGIGRYVFNLAQAMIPLFRTGEWLTLLRDPTQPSHWNHATLAGERTQVVDVPISPFSLRQQWIIRRLLRSMQTNLYHSPYYLMPYWPGVPTVLTVYDLIPLLFPQLVSSRARLLFRWTTALALRTADRVIAISQATCRDLASIFQISPQKVTVIPLAVHPDFQPQPPAVVERARRKYRLPQNYILYLGINKPHKNLVRLIEAFSRITHHASRITLVVAGAWDSRYPESRQRAATLGLENTLCFLGSVAEEDLPALYGGATLFVFPSKYEGFGLPLLEAMACGTPVACANTSSLPEVGGDAALYFDPTDVEAIAETLCQALADADLRAELRQRGLGRAAEFSWERTARETLKLYREVLS